MEGLEALRFAQEQDEDDRLFLRWISPGLGYQTEFGFSEYKKQLKQQAQWESQSSEKIVSNIDTMMEGVAPPLGNL